MQSELCEHERLSENLQAEIAAGKFQAVKDSYAALMERAARRPVPKNDTLLGIAQFAVRKHQPDILDWCFSEGLEVPLRDTLNDDLFESAMLAKSKDVWNVLLAREFPKQLPDPTRPLHSIALMARTPFYQAT